MENKRKTALIMLTIVEVLLIGLLTFVLLVNKGIVTEPKEQEVDVEDTTVPDDETYEPVEEIVQEEIEGHVIRESAWMPPWYFNESFDSLKSYVDVLDTVNPVFYGVNANGTLLNRKPKEDTVSSFLQYCIENEIRVIPTVGSYSYDITDSLFVSESTYKEHIKNILIEIDKYDFDGIDIDYENIRKEKKDNYISFLRELGNELSQREKILSVAVFPQWGDDVSYKSHTDTIFAQDYALIGEIADEVRIMTYDYTLPSSSTPGPIGPIDWMEDVIEYSITKISKEKIWLGIHLYGYMWKGSEATAFTPATYKSIVENPNVNTQFKEDVAEGYAEYSCDGTTCYLYYQSKEGVNIRRQLALEYELAGVSYWSLGRDDGLLSVD
jgi:spore germination protein YaaH